MDSLLTPEIISTVGFPIACCIALFWFNVNTMRQQQQMLDGMKEALNENTKAMQLLIAKMDK